MTPDELETARQGYRDYPQSHTANMLLAHLPGPEKADLLDSARRFEQASLSRGLELGALIEECFLQKAQS